MELSHPVALALKLAQNALTEDRDKTPNLHMHIFPAYKIAFSGLRVSSGQDVRM
jgi:hypothetical protein